jgi:hypothetical protein
VARRLGSGEIFMADFELLRDDVDQIEQTMVDIVLLPQQPIPPKSCVAV